MDANPHDSMGIPVLTADGSLSLHQPAYGEEYHSKHGARTEAEALYMDASGFGARLACATAPLAVFDVGLGLGYNALATIGRTVRWNNISRVAQDEQITRVCLSYEIWVYS